MPDPLTNISLEEHDRSSVILADLSYMFRSIEIRRRISRPHQAALAFAAAGMSESLQCSRRRILVFDYNGAREELWRIETRTIEKSGSRPAQLRCKPLWMDLEQEVARKTLSTGFVDHDLTITGVTASSALSTLLSSAWNAPSRFRAGTVEGAIDEEVFVHLKNATHLEGVRAIAEQVGGEWQAVWDSTDEKYDINIVEEIGSSTSSTRLIYGEGTTVNRLTLTQKNDASKYFSAVAPVGGAQEGTITIADATWAIQSASYDSTAGTTTITFDRKPIWADGVLTSADFEGHAVQSSTAPDQIVVSGDASGLSRGTFTQSGGDDLTELVDPSAESQLGRQVKTIEEQVAPFANLLVREGVSADLSDMSSGVASGWSAVGSPTLAEETAAEYVKQGTSSQKVTADTDEGVETNTITLPDSSNSLHSTQVNLLLDSGQVRVEFVDSNGDVHPSGEKAATNATGRVISLAIGGAQIENGPVQLRVIAEEDGTVFYIDAATVTQSGSAYPYQKDMGPSALWMLAAEELTKNGGITPDGFESRFFDLAHLDDATYDEVTLGDYVEVQDEDLSSFTGRVVEVRESEFFDEGRIKKQVRLSRKKETFKDRIVGGKPEPMPASQSTKPVTLPSVEANYHQVNVSGTETGRTVLTLTDPNNFVTKVEARTASGRNIDDSSDSWTEVSAEPDGTYQIDVTLTEGHPSTTQWRVFTGGHGVLSGAHTFDYDRVPDGSFELLWEKSANSGEVLVKVSYQGDEDTASCTAKLDTTNNGTYDETITTDGRAGVVAFSSSLTPGGKVKIRAQLYNETGGSGTGSAEPFEEVVEIPFRSEIDGGDLIDGTVDGSVKIQDGTVIADKIQAGTITATEIQADTITANEIFAGTITATEIAADTITADEIKAGTITADLIKAGEIDASKLTVQVLHLKDGTWSNNTPSVDYVQWSGFTAVYDGVAHPITDGSTNLEVIWWDSANPGVFQADTRADFESAFTPGDGDQLVAINNSGTVEEAWNATEVNGNFVRSDTFEGRHYKADSIDADKIVADTITANEISAGTITASEIKAGTITASEISAGTITANEIAAGTITASEIQAGAIDTTSLAADSVTATEIAADAIDGTHIKAAAQITVGSSTPYIYIDGQNTRIETSNYASGVSGMRLSPEILETNNILARGTFRASVFEYQNISAVGGAMVVANASVLDEDISAGTTTFDVKHPVFSGSTEVRIKYNNQEEELEITGVSTNGDGTQQLTVNRGINGTTAQDWYAGTAIIEWNQGRITHDASDAPYTPFMSVVDNSDTERVRIGNLNGVSGASGYGMWLINGVVGGFGIDATTISTQSLLIDSANQFIRVTDDVLQDRAFLGDVTLQDSAVTTELFWGMWDAVQDGQIYETYTVTNTSAYPQPYFSMEWTLQDTVGTTNSATGPEAPGTPLGYRTDGSTIEYQDGEFDTWVELQDGDIMQDETNSDYDFKWVDPSNYGVSLSDQMDYAFSDYAMCVPYGESVAWDTITVRVYAYADLPEGWSGRPAEFIADYGEIEHPDANDATTTLNDLYIRFRDDNDSNLLTLGQSSASNTVGQTAEQHTETGTIPAAASRVELYMEYESTTSETGPRVLDGFWVRPRLKLDNVQTMVTPKAVQTDSLVFNAIGSSDPTKNWKQRQRVNDVFLDFIYNGDSKGYLDPASDQGLIDFTGQHRSVPGEVDMSGRTVTDGQGTVIGYKGARTNVNPVPNHLFTKDILWAMLDTEDGAIVSSQGDYYNLDGTTKPKINEALPKVIPAITAGDPAVFGVMSTTEDPNSGQRVYQAGAFTSVFDIQDEPRLIVNALGEGAIYVSDINGNISNGDFIESSWMVAIGQRQTSDQLTNSTVAKATQDCTFDLSASDYECWEREVYDMDGNVTTVKVARIGCTYHCG